MSKSLRINGQRQSMGRQVDSPWVHRSMGRLWCSVANGVTGSSGAAASAVGGFGDCGCIHSLTFHL